MVGEKNICPNCGSENLEGAAFCMECGSKLEKVEERKKPEKIEYANLSQRFTAYVIDTVILYIICGIISLIVVWAVMAITPYSYYSYPDYYPPDSPYVGNLVGIVTLMIFSLVTFFYFVLLEGRGGRGQTVGKMLVSIRVVDENTMKPIGYGQSFARNILRIIDGLFFYLIGIILIYTSDKHQRLGDRAAGSIVIYER